MSKRHLVFIINPRAGVERQKAVQTAIDSKLDLQRYTYEIVHTARAKHGIELAKDAAAKGAFAVVAVGGDGSVNDIVAGLAGTETALAIIPKGSGNGMARAAGIPLEELKAMEVINKGNTAMIDLGFANDQPFISNAGIAFDALISKKFAENTKRGFISYSQLVTKHLWNYKEWDWTITIDGKTFTEKAFIIAVANGKQFGYNFQIAPTADWTDGLLDIVVIHKFPRLFGAGLVIRAMTGTLLNSPYVKHYTGKRITITHPELKLMQTDGDAHACTNKVEFRVEQCVQKVIVP